MKNKKLILLVTLIMALTISLIVCFLFIGNKTIFDTYKLDLQSLKYSKNDKNINQLTVYTQDNFDNFKKDYQDNKLPSVYVTEFLYDGVSMYKAYDLDDFIEGGNELELEPFKITTINITEKGNYEFSGEITDAMIAVNSNELNGDVNIILNNVKLDTNSKKVPAIYVYNKDRNYTDYKVTIKAKKNTKNYIEGGKLKEVSLIPSDNLDSYSNKYSGANKTNYETYANYYGVYTEKEINNILFAKLTANIEDLQDGDPVYSYKASGAISSDIDLYFEGEGYLEITSKNKEGVETKGNLTFSGGTGDYVIHAEDDCLNTTTEEQGFRNELTIDVKSLTAIVSLEADEGDAIDSNGTLTINGGRIIAIAHPGQDAGLDLNKGTYINGGSVIATGDMYDEISSDSKQMFIALNFGKRVEGDTLITMLDSSDIAIFSYLTDRTYSYLVFSSYNLGNDTYSLYKNGEVTGEEENGLYLMINNYVKGEQLAYTNKESPMRGPGGRPDERGPADPGRFDHNNQPPEGYDSSNPPTSPHMPDGNNPMEGPGTNQGNTTATNKDFILDDIANIFNGVALYFA